MGEAKQPLEARGLGQEQRDCPRVLRPFLRAAEDLSRTRKRRAQVLALAVRSLARLDLAVRAAQQRVDLGGAGGRGGELRGVEIQVEAEDGLCESTRVDQRAQGLLVDIVDGAHHCFDYPQTRPSRRTAGFHGAPTRIGANSASKTCALGNRGGYCGLGETGVACPIGLNGSRSTADVRSSSSSQ